MKHPLNQRASALEAEIFWVHFTTFAKKERVSFPRDLQCISFSVVLVLSALNQPGVDVAPAVHD